MQMRSYAVRNMSNMRNMFDFFVDKLNYYIDGFKNTSKKKMECSSSNTLAH